MISDLRQQAGGGRGREPGGGREETEAPRVDSVTSLACKLERIRRILEEKRLEKAVRGEKYNITG